VNGIHQLLDKVDPETTCVALVQTCLQIRLGDGGWIKGPAVVVKLDDQSIAFCVAGASNSRRAWLIRRSLAAVCVLDDVAARLVHGNLHRIYGPGP
jgi:hypothetical protein